MDNRFFDSHHFMDYAIHQAVAQNDIEEVKRLLTANPALANAVGKNDSYPLHIATNLEVTEILVKFGADVNAPGWMGNTPLHYAVEKDRFEVAQFLITHDANVKATRHYDITPLHWAKNIRMARLLIDNGALISVKNEFGETPMFTAVKVYDLAFLNVLVEHGADVNVRENVYGSTPLHITSNLAIMHRLLELGANVDVIDKSGQTPLHKAAVRGDVAFLQLLLDYGADITIRDFDGFTPLHLARSRGQQANIEAFEAYINANHIGLYKIPERLESKAVIANPRRSEAITIVDHAILARWSLSQAPQLLKADYTEQPQISNIACLPDGQSFVIGTRTNNVRLCRWDDFAEIRTLHRPSDGYIHSLAVSPNGHWMALGDDQENVYLLDIESGKTITQIPGGEFTGAISFGSDSHLIAIACSFQGGGYVSIHRLSENNELQQIYELDRSNYTTSEKEFVDTLVDVAFSPDSKWLALFETSRIYHDHHPDGWRGNLVLYSLDAGKLLWEVSIDANITGDSRPLNRAGYASGFFTRLFFLNNNTIICGSTAGKILCFNVVLGKLEKVISLDSNAAIIDLALDASGTTIWTVLDNGELGTIPVPVEKI